MGTKGFSPEFLEGLMAYNWPGNVREFVNAMDNSITNAQGDHTLFPIHLPIEIRTQLARASVNANPSEDSSSGVHTNTHKTPSRLREFLALTERHYLQDLMALTDGNVKEACRLSGLSRSRLYERLKKYSIRRP